MAKANLTIRVADIPEVKAALEAADNTIDDLRHLLQMWEPRVTCPQCGKRYSARACGPSHVAVRLLVEGGK